MGAAIQSQACGLQINMRAMNSIRALRVRPKP